MTATTTPTTPASTTDASQSARQPGRLAPSGLVGGIGGLVFVATVVAQNAMRAGFPTNDTGAGAVVDYYSAHRDLTTALAVLLPIGALGLAAFIGGVMDRVGSGPNRGAAYGGAFGAAGILAMFSMLGATDFAIAGYVQRAGASPDVVEGLWVLHNAIFGILLASIGVALAGFSAAAAADDLIATWWKGLGLLGAILLLAAAATTPAIIDASPTMAIGLGGFLVWVAFVSVTSIELIRSAR